MIKKLVIPLNNETYSDINYAIESLVSFPFITIYLTGFVFMYYRHEIENNYGSVRSYKLDVVLNGKEFLSGFLELELV